VLATFSTLPEHLNTLTCVLKQWDVGRIRVTWRRDVRQSRPDIIGLALTEGELRTVCCRRVSKQPGILFYVHLDKIPLSPSLPWYQACKIE